MKLEQLIGEATEYDKKAMLEIKKPKPVKGNRFRHAAYRKDFAA